MSLLTEERNHGLTKVESGSIVTPKGFSATGIHTGMKRKRNDLGAIMCEVPADSAAVYTLSKMQAAPLKVTKESLASEGKLRTVVINSGIANACTGKQGEQDAYAMRSEAASHFGVPEHQVAVNSTGVIGDLLPMDTLTEGIRQLVPTSESTEADQFCEAILTTDTVTKQTCYQANIDGKTISMGGAAKGSGMIHPNMATMLSFVTTDARINHSDLQAALKEVTDLTFNRITVDGDTSTNDMVLVMASGQAGNKELSPEHPEWGTFLELLRKTCEDLAKMIARDGEGATKLIEVEVRGAKNDEEAGRVAKEIAGSDLVKTAMFGKDANWGRIIGAIGQSDAEVDPDHIDIALGPIAVLEESQTLSFSEKEATAYLDHETVNVIVDLHVGDGFAKAWGCDLTYEYVRINASYRT
ncbi:MAG TPA: bifunctional glutamate N-acetyltransferase/amino-acid acetyltransferase ArgJ [Bacillales bacterium]|nr:bifunctional glutamate N-acetyltransferase/amino-acid acetyltransferase ArgJ [Bacillales bacterium]